MARKLAVIVAGALAQLAARLQGGMRVSGQLAIQEAPFGRLLLGQRTELAGGAEGPFVIAMRLYWPKDCASPWLSFPQSLLLRATTVVSA
jgi:hypothetical protein